MAAGKLHTAIERGFFQQVRFLVDRGEDINSRDGQGRTPLILCSYISDDSWASGLARLLIENGARISRCDRLGFNALHHACINEKHELVDVYLSALDCDINSKCKQGNTSLHYAALAGNLEIVASLAKLLIKYRLSLDPKNKHGQTPLHQAFKANNLDCGDLLVQYGADVTIEDANHRTGLELRHEAEERVELIQELSRSRPASHQMRRMKAEAEADKPKITRIPITEAKEADLRNDPTYVFNVSPIEYFQHKLLRELMSRDKNEKSKNKMKGEMWKNHILFLWTYYETKYSNSYRKSASRELVTNSEPRRESSTSSTDHVPSLHRKSSRMSVKSKTGSFDATPRRSINSSRRNSGMPPLVRAQTRTSFNPP